MEFDCVICGSPMDAPRSMLGCTMFCDDCYSKPELIDWYRDQQRKKMEALNANPA